MTSHKYKYLASIEKGWIVSIGLYYLFTAVVWAEDSLDSVMQRMEPAVAVRVQYQETRFMSLLAQPWQGSGYMYALPPDTLVKEQLQPARELMGADDKRLYYYDPVKNVRHQGRIQDDDPVSVNVLAFKALMNGDRALLQKRYHIEFGAFPEYWVLTLKPRDETAGEVLERIEVSGFAGEAANKVNVFMADGDYSEFVLSKDASGEQVRDAVLQRIQELQAQ